MPTLRKWLLRGLALLFAIAAVMGIIGAIVAGERGPFLLAPLLWCAAAGGLWYWSGAKSRAGAQAGDLAARLADEAAQYFAAVNEAGSFPPSRTDRIISTPEREVLAACDARLFELTSQRARNHIGTRINLGGAPVYVGRSIPVSSTELREAASGELAVTADMLIFSGPLKSVDIALARITSVDIMVDGITLGVTGRQKPVTFQVANGLLWGQLIKNLLQVKIQGRSIPAGYQLRPM